MSPRSGKSVVKKTPLRCSTRLSKYLSRSVDIASINNKEDFFLAIGLKLIETCPVDNIEKDREMIKVKECSVQIIGNLCKICGRHFKCSTDLAVHMKWRHNSFEMAESTKAKHADTELDNYKIMPFKPKNFKYKPKAFKDKIRLIFKVGSEVLTEKNVKRKHLKKQENTINCSPKKTSENILTNTYFHEKTNTLPPESLCNSQNTFKENIPNENCNFNNVIEKRCLIGDAIYALRKLEKNYLIDLSSSSF